MKVAAVDNIQQITRKHTGSDTDNSHKKNNKNFNNISNAKENVFEKDKVINEEKIIEAIEKANESLVFQKTKLKFSIHDGTKEIMVKVIDENTDEVVREIPREKILDMLAKMWELAGLFIDEKV
jgi:flagellar protein FlaG